MDSLILLIRLGAYLVSEPLLALALFSMGLVLAGTLILHRFPVGGQVLHWVGNAGVFLALVLTALQVVRASQRYRPAPALPLPLPISLDGQQTDATGLSGNEIRVPLASDGNFWIEATINGRPERFLVDTGATITIIPPGAARSALVTDEAGRQSVQLRTANGTVQAKPVTIAQLRVGTFITPQLDALVAPGTGGTSVLGMNFLSRLKAWRVEGNTLIMVPPANDRVTGEQQAR